MSPKDIRPMQNNTFKKKNIMVHSFMYKVRTGPTHQCLYTDTGEFTGCEHHTVETLKCLFIFSNKIQC